MEVLIQHYGHDGHVNAAGAIQDRLRKQMQADALSTDQEDEDGNVSTRLEKQKNKHVEVNQEYDPDFLEEAIHFLRLQVGPLASCLLCKSDISQQATGPTASRASLSSDSLCILFLLWHGV